MSVKWVLKTLKDGLYFREMTDIGPRYTNRKREAARFSSKIEAIRSPAYLHPLSMCQPIKIR